MTTALFGGLFIVIVGLSAQAPVRSQEVGDAEPGESGLYLPTDRQQERLLDHAVRAVKEGRWSDAAALLDEVLGADRDSFFRSRTGRDGAGGGTWSSVKAEASRMIAALPQPGREAYELQFRARAERLLAESIDKNDHAAVVAVARRWFATPAGQRAALLAAVDALESNQPLTAAAWLERLPAADDAIGPTLEVMRALAQARAGDPAAASAILERARVAARGAARIAGKDVVLSFPPGGGLKWLAELDGGSVPAAGNTDYRQPRGEPARNAVAVATRPLLVPRYRVPLTSHPEEGRRLEALRRERADVGAAAFPAGMPLAVDGVILARTPLGLLAVDFATGKRIWLQPGSRSAATGFAAGVDTVAHTFDDFTSGGLSSDGRLVFVVDSHPDAMVAAAGTPFGAAARREPMWQGGNTLSAYDIAASGRLVWRLPAGTEGADADDGGPTAGMLESATWFAGAPLVVGDRLYVLVEDKSELRLDVLTADAGRRVWSQPLAELDESHAIMGRDAVARRLAGAAPSLGDGVLVCPLAAGTVIAVDLAQRTLLWAYAYAAGPRADAEAAAINAGRLRGFQAAMRAIDMHDGPPGRPRPGWCADGPVIAAGRVLLAPGDSDELHCLDLRTGAVRWKVPREARIHVAGVVDDRVVVVARDAVEMLALDTGRPLWRRPLDAGVSPSGRGIVTADRLFLPLDVPEVIEIALADGAVAGRSPGRGHAVPGNLVAYRGEVISLGGEAIDVFHQAAALEDRIETASRVEPAAAWPAVWAAQLAIDRGDVGAGLAGLRSALAAAPARQPPDTLATALAFALRRDFAVAAPLWRDCLPEAGLTPAVRAAVRAVVDGSIASGDLAEAWAAWRELFIRGRAADLPLVAEPDEAGCIVTEGRWLRGRLATLRRLATGSLPSQIDAVLAADLAAVAQSGDPAGRQRALESLVEVAGDIPVGMAARERLVDELSALLDAAAEDDEEMRSLVVRRDCLLLDLARSGDPRQRGLAREAIGGICDRLGTGGSALEEEPATAWPLGRVEVRRSTAERGTVADDARSRLVPIRLDQAAESFVPGLAAVCDAQQSRLLFVDRFGRRLGEGLAVNDDIRRGIPMFDQSTLGAAALGRLVFVRSGANVTAVELAGREHRRVWTTADGTQTTAVGRFRGMAGGVPRNGGVPLGMRISEPGGVGDDAAVWGRPVTSGLPVLRGRGLVLLDPVSGDVLWERRRLPPATEIVNDDEVVCVATTDGHRSPVLSMADGRFLRAVELPDHRRRLLASGRRILTIGGLDEPAAGGVADTVRLELLDVADGSSIAVGQFSGGARACAFAPGMVAVIDPGGDLTAIDVTAGRTAFRSRLPAMPGAFEHLEVMPWEDRLLVCVGGRDRAEADEGTDRHAVAPLQQMLVAGLANQPMDFSVWAVDRESGDPLWSAPATVARHCLLAGQPAGLPVLVFARQVQRNQNPGSTFLSLLCLDKRTGHAVLEDDRIPAEPHFLFGCDVIGDPLRHTITVREHGGNPQRVTLAFTGGPMPPRPPHQAGRTTKAQGFFDGVWHIIEDTLTPDRDR